jgi:hypothetical protein
MTANISVSPNPFTNLVNVEIEGINENMNYCVVRLYDEKGKILKMLGVSLQNGINKVLIDRLNMLHTGKYFLDVKSIGGKSIYITSLLKQ